MPAKPNKTPELEANWTLEAGEKAFVIKDKAAHTRLGSALLFKFFELYGRFPERGTLVAPQIVEYLAHQVSANPASWGTYDLEGRSAQAERTRIRKHFGFRPSGVADLAALTCPCP